MVRFTAHGDSIKDFDENLDACFTKRICMKRCIFVLSIILLMNHACVIGMRESCNPEMILSDIAKTIQVSPNHLAIACTPTELIIVDDYYCSFWNYKTEMLLRMIPTGLNPDEISSNKIYAHPKKDISI